MYMLKATIAMVICQEPILRCTGWVRTDNIRPCLAIQHQYLSSPSVIIATT
jgi:hypothetical protein